MSGWIAAGDDAAWQALHDRTWTSVFRLEAQQTYSSAGEDAAVANFLRGEPHGMSFDAALATLRANRDRGTDRVTVRVATEPPTDYTRWNLAVYPEFDAAGETVRVIATRHGEWPAGVPRHDFFIFDDVQVWRMHYVDHAFVGAALLDEPDEIGLYRRWRAAALDQAVSIHDYLAAHPENGRPPAA